MCLVLENPELDPVLQVWPHQCWTEGKDHCPQPAGSPPADAAWAVNSLFSSWGTLLAPAYLACPPGPPSVFLSSCLWAGGCPACMVPGIVPSQVQDFAEVPISSLLQPVEVLLDGSPLAYQFSKHAWGQAQYQSLGHTASSWPPTRLCVTPHRLLGSALWEILKQWENGWAYPSLLWGCVELHCSSVLQAKCGQMTHCSLTVTSECLRPLHFWNTEHFSSYGLSVL